MLAKNWKIASSVGKQFKRLQDLGKGLLARMRFKAFRIQISQRQFMLEGFINPWVLLASGKVVELQENELPELARVGDELMTPAGRGQIVALGNNPPDDELISLIDRRSPRGSKTQKLDGKGSKIQIDTPRTSVEEGLLKEDYKKFVEEWKKYKNQLAERRYQGMKEHPQGTEQGDWERYQHYMAERGRKAPGQSMTFEEWTELSRTTQSLERSPGEGIKAKGVQWGNLESKAYGHAVSEHGATRKSLELQDRARTTGSPQGHWIDNEYIIEAERLAPLKSGEHIINMGKPVGNIYLPDGTILENVQIIKLIRNKNLTVKTAYPFN